MIQAIIIDDEALILDNLTYIFQQLPDTRLLGAYQDPSKALADYPSLHPDVVIVDINMPYMNGLEFAEKLRELDKKANIIFLTAYDNYALDAFSVHAVDYILKPVTTSKLKNLWSATGKGICTYGAAFHFRVRRAPPENPGTFK